MIYFISHNDIEDCNFESIISDEISKFRNILYLTATPNLKRLRKESLLLSSFFNSDNDKKGNLYSISEFIQHTSRDVYEEGNYLSISDQKYIIGKAIEYYYQNNTAMQNAMYQMRYDLGELYQRMLFHNVKLNDEQIQRISSDFSNVEADIFSVYQLVKKIIDDLLTYMSTGTSSETLTSVLGNNFLKTKDKSIDIFINRQKECVQKRIAEADAVFFEGLYFFNEMLFFILSIAIRENKAVYFISKQFEDGSGDFIFEKSIKAFADSFSVSIKNIHLGYKTGEPKTALDYTKRLFPLSNPKVRVDDEQLIHDGSIIFMSPFINREEELRYVAKSISLTLKNSYDDDINKLKNILNNDIAIVLSIENNYEERLSNIFREIGLFIFNQEKITHSDFLDIDINSFKTVYFSRNDFFAADVKWRSGDLLSYQDKHAFFEKGFDRIDINKKPRSIASYPIGQFVLEVYGIINEGMNIEGFKRILYSNWRYNVDEAGLKWSDFISEFKYLEIYFENQETVLDWHKIVKELIVLKSEIEDNKLYVYHPLKQVKIESLSFFDNLLCELNELTSKISSVVGSIDSHLKILKSVVMKADRILGTDNEKLEFEQIILKKLILAVTDIGKSSIVNNLESKYFARNIKAMLTDWENQNQLEQSGTLALNVVNLNNIKKYKFSYFIVCEANKYPRKYIESFPFNGDILEILRNPNYGINIALPEYKGLEYHLQLERYLFKNVLDFTTEKLIITHCEKEGNNYNKPSIYAKDIATAFGLANIPYIEPDIEDRNSAIEFKNSSDKVTFQKKNSYTLKELAIFKLCPKLYYHQQSGDNKGVYLSRLQLKFYAEAILYCDLFQRFMDYNLKNKKVYLKDSTEYLEIIPELFKECCRDNIKHFLFFGKYEIEDTIRNVSNKLKGVIENSVQYLKGNTYTVISYTDKNYEGNGYTLTIEHDNRVVDYDKKTWRMSQNRSYLEFLVLKTSDKKTELKHYADMIMALDRNLPDLDRVNLISRIIAKINIQFDSRRFAGDGIARTDDLVSQINSYDFGNAEAMSSGYCTYCRFYDICMAK